MLSSTFHIAHWHQGPRRDPDLPLAHVLDQVVCSQHPLPELQYYRWTLESSLYQKQLSSARGGSLRGAFQAAPPFLGEFYLGFAVVLKINILKGKLSLPEQRLQL